MSIQIANLTPYQVEMLDAMWACETLEDYTDWYNLLDAEDQDLADSLQHLIIIESMEEWLSDLSNQFADVREYLKKFML